MIYFFEALDNSRIKIGFTGRHPDHRRKALQLEQKMQLIPLGYMNGDKAAEKLLHGRFADHRITGEWFIPNPELREFIRENAKSLEAVDDYSDDFIVTTVRIPASMYEAVVGAASINRRSINNQLVTLIEAALAPPAPHKQARSNTE